ncbi:hypothetical protein KTQ42_22900 [Noviherbaspirillum sp. L7-7A]|uniref:hypothetical protein n=1 Tax=Noviherbaspirillum sp. L7-7A TaxID=2850560 RepID=UPI001C2C6B39|nr:hypothetical protein [Noviherbaspirillum sp. L7-7A]MBV0882129.1 hypothetical protein [Noviherbaspirillum sp. L7-7A]
MPLSISKNFLLHNVLSSVRVSIMHGRQDAQSHLRFFNVRAPLINLDEMTAFALELVTDLSKQTVPAYIGIGSIMKRVHMLRQRSRHTSKLLQLPERRWFVQTETFQAGKVIYDLDA